MQSDLKSEAISAGNTISTVVFPLDHQNPLRFAADHFVTQACSTLRCKIPGKSSDAGNAVLMRMGGIGIAQGIIFCTGTQIHRLIQIDGFSQTDPAIGVYAEAIVNLIVIDKIEWYDQSACCGGADPSRISGIDKVLIIAGFRSQKHTACDLLPAHFRIRKLIILQRCRERQQVHQAQ
ncbi:hypothetical protein DSECCO2_555590 [anaerobic digester metagenome]